jgi:hypothetical protein
MLEVSSTTDNIKKNQWTFSTAPLPLINTPVFYVRRIVGED